MSLKHRVISGVRWTVSAVIARRFGTFAASVIVARLIEVEDFGAVAMAMVFVGIVELFRDLGTGTVIIQKEVMSEELLSTIFWFNLAFGTLAAVLLFILAQPIAEFYGQPRVAPVLKLLSSGFVLSGMSVTHASLLMRAMRFARLAIAETLAVLAGAATAIALAYAGFGMWSLVWQSLVTTTMTCLLLWVVDEWRPMPKFDRHVLTETLRYSLNLTAFNFVNYLARSADNALIGRYLGAQQLGYYDLAYRTFLIPLQLISWSVARVMLPVYGKLQADNDAFRRTYVATSQAIAFVSFPLMLGLLAVPDLFVVIVFGEKWRPAAPVLAILAPLGALQSIATTGGSIYLAKGRADKLMRWGVATSPLVVASFIVGLPWGIVGVATAYASVSACLYVAGLVIPFRYIDLRMKEFAKAMVPTFLCAAGMLVAVLLTRNVITGSVSAPVALAVCVIVGAGVYALLTLLFNRAGILIASRILSRQVVS